jgi:hypothetical protein
VTASRRDQSPPEREVTMPTRPADSLAPTWRARRPPLRPQLLHACALAVSLAMPALIHAQATPATPATAAAPSSAAAPSTAVSPPGSSTVATPAAPSAPAQAARPAQPAQPAAGAAPAVRQSRGNRDREDQRARERRRGGDTPAAGSKD